MPVVLGVGLVLVVPHLDKVGEGRRGRGEGARASIVAEVGLVRVQSGDIVEEGLAGGENFK